MNRTGTWSCVARIDSHAFSNIPMQQDNEYHYHEDPNPEAKRRRDHWKWVGAGHIPDSRRAHCFYRDHDCDTVEEDWAVKEVIIGAIVNRRLCADDHEGWSIVVRTVIRWEEQKIRKLLTVTTHNYATFHVNKKPTDLQRWEEQHELRLRNSRDSMRPRKRNIQRQRNPRRSMAPCSRKLEAIR